MKYTKILTLGILLVGMQAGSRAQVFQVFQKDMNTTKFQASEVDSVSHNDADALTTFYLKNGSKQTFQKESTDSIVWYDPTHSILATLRNGYFTSFSNYLQLLRDCGNEFPNWRERWTDYLNGATDLTVFAANDEAWQRFFAKNAKLPASNPWHTATSYDALTPDQKQTLLASALTPVRKLNEMGKKGILRLRSSILPNDVWTPVLTPEYCALNSITEEDQRIICGAPITTPWMPGADITSIDVACTNGYLEEVSNTLTPLATMADIIRNNGQTNIFAHIMDFLQQQPEDPYGYGSLLKFDPGWAGYYDDYLPEKDMAAMFVPNDASMWQFFTEGAGQALLQTYVREAGGEDPLPYVKPTTQEELLQQLDKVPASVLVSFANTIMMRSFAGSVPSKMLKLRDDALEQLFYADDLDKIQTCLMACNGAVYIMDKVYGPQNLTGVCAPAYASTDARIMTWAIYDQNNMGLNYYAYLKAPQQDITFFLPSDAALAYYYDPSSMKSKTPRVIVMSYKNVRPGRVAVVAKCWKYIDPYGTNPASAEQPKGSIGGQLMSSAGNIDETDITNRLKDILLSHTILNDGTQDINSRNEYYRTYGGDVVKVIRDASGKIVGAKGTFQLENERQGITGNETSMGVTGCNVTASFESLSNGQTFTLDAPLIPTYRSLWSILTDDMKETDSRYNPKGYTDEAWEANPYSAFYDLCAADRYQDAIMGCGLVDGRQGSAARKAAMQKYLIFTNGYGLDYNFAPLIGNTPYTAYIPTNEAVKRAIDQGLPTWEDIYQDYQSHRMPDLDPDTGKPYTNDEGEIEYTNMLQSAEDSIRIANKIMTLTNVIKAHFHFGMAIADQEPFQGEYKSLAMDENLVSRKLKVNSTGNGNMTVTDWNGRTFNVLNKNVFARDISCSKYGNGTSPRNVNMQGIVIDSSRPAVIHQIDGMIGFK
ncbi:MAG: hypothetical protein IKH05_05590 [Bacteroidaceae bacterium]|nr:hypothetical protein [Bacteroidaceae bacterium]